MLYKFAEMFFKGRKKMHLNRFVLGFLFGNCLIANGNVTFKPHEAWWEKHVETMMPTFASWLGDYSSISRVKVREHIRAKNYKSILDIPCGLCTDFFGFQRDSMDVQYFGIDITPKLIKLAQEKNIPVRQGSIEDIPCLNSSFDVCYSRHILEHIPYYEKAIQELIRVAKFEVLIVFFIKPTDEPDKIVFDSDLDWLIYHNYYNRQKLEEYVLKNPRTKSIEWQDANDKEVLFHIYLK